MDRTDRFILERLQANCRTPIQTLAEDAAASPASIQRRLKRLREDGTIEREVAVIDPKRAGFSVTTVITVELERDSADRVDAFKRRVHAEPQVQQCYCVAGDTDFVLIALLRDMEDYETFTARFFQDPNVRHYRSAIVVSRVKTSVAVPLTGEVR